MTERGTRNTATAFGHHRELSAKVGISDGSMSERTHHHRAYSDLASNSAKLLPAFEDSKTVIKNFGKIASFAVNTHKGCVRNYNEDRVSILLNAQQRSADI